MSIYKSIFTCECTAACTLSWIPLFSLDSFHSIKSYWSPPKIFGELRDIWPGYFTLQITNYQGADLTARTRRLVCAFVVRNQEKSGFLVSMSIWCWIPGFLASTWLRAWCMLLSCKSDQPKLYLPFWTTCSATRKRSVRTLLPLETDSLYIQIRLLWDPTMLSFK